jgi:hypothetical protein
MLRERTYIVRIYRREGTPGRLAGTVEIIDEQRCVSFAGLSALGAILARPSAGGGQGPGRRTRRPGGVRT